jgi:2-phosphosulfolactate phosphatase
MNIDFYSAFQEVSKEQLDGKNVVVIDVLRATSVIVTALAGGAKSIIPVESIEEARALAAAKAPGTTLLAGERDGLPIPGFDLGNSPPLFNPETVTEKEIILTTMHGTRALQLCEGAKQTIIGSLLNADAVVEHMLSSRDSWKLLCSGMQGRFTLDDGLCAGLLLSRLAEHEQIRTRDLGSVMQSLYESNRGALESLLEQHCYGYQYLQAQGFQEDLDFCLDVDRYKILPRFTGGRVTAGGE